MQQVVGAKRMVAWDDDWLKFSSDISHSEIKWSAIEKVKNGRVGIYLFVGRKIYLGIHKKALSQNIPTEDLIRVFQNHSIPVI
jgi:hypothetical protein